MEQLVNQVLTWRNAERATDDYVKSIQDPEAIVTGALAPFYMDEEQGARLEVVVEPDLPSVTADGAAVGEAVRNLVGNALKYSEAGAVVVTVRSYAEGVAFSVRDPGPEIPRKEHKRIFKRFYRGPGTNNKPGTGLGLAISRHVARSHGGALDLRSSTPGGNVFTLRLPTYGGDEASAEPEPEPGAQPEETA